MDEREKIIEIIAPFISAYGEDEAIADALIAANMGDVTAWKERAEKHRFMALPDGRIKQLYSDKEVEQIVKERDEYKHRAEIADRALATVCEEVLHARYPVESVTVSVVDDFIQHTLKEAECEIEEEKGE